MVLLVGTWCRPRGRRERGTVLPRWGWGLGRRLGLLLRPLSEMCRGVGAWCLPQLALRGEGSRLIKDGCEQRLVLLLVNILNISCTFVGG